MKIGLVGGSFDPIHRGHILLGEYALKQFDLDEIWFLPAGQPYMKAGRDVSAPEERKAMTKRAIYDLPWARLCSLELERPGRSYTYETLEQLQAEQPENEYYFILGGDQLDKLDQWRYPERVLASARIIAAGRGSGADYKAMEEKAAALTGRFGGRIHLMDFPALDISSTEIRQRAAAGESLEDLVPPAVETYIKRQGLYRVTLRPEAKESHKAYATPLPRAAIFDMDGTLLDTENLCIREWVALDGSGDPDLPDLIAQVCGFTREDTKKFFLGHYGPDYPFEAIQERLEKRFEELRCSGEFPVKPGAAQVLEKLFLQGFLLGLASSTHRRLVLPELASVGLLVYFDVIVCGDDVKQGKPDPEIFQKAAALLGREPGHCFGIEDAYHGVRALKGAGLRPIMIPDVKAPDEEMKSLAEIILPDLKSACEYMLNG